MITIDKYQIAPTGIQSVIEKTLAKNKKVQNLFYLHTNFLQSHTFFTQSHVFFLDSHVFFLDSHVNYSDSHVFFSDLHVFFSDLHVYFPDSHVNGFCLVLSFLMFHALYQLYGMNKTLWVYLNF